MDEDSFEPPSFQEMMAQDDNSLEFDRNIFMGNQQAYSLADNRPDPFGRLREVNTQRDTPEFHVANDDDNLNLQSSADSPAKKSDDLATAETQQQPILENQPGLWEDASSRGATTGDELEEDIVGKKDSGESELKVEQNSESSTLETVYRAVNLTTNKKRDESQGHLVQDILPENLSLKNCNPVAETKIFSEVPKQKDNPSRDKISSDDDNNVTKTADGDKPLALTAGVTASSTPKAEVKVLEEAEGGNDTEDQDEEADLEDGVEGEGESGTEGGMSAQKARHAITGRGVTLAMLMADGLIKPGDGTMSIEYLGQKFTGDLLEDSSIRSNEYKKIFNSPSAWAIHCKKIVNPKKKKVPTATLR